VFQDGRFNFTSTAQAGFRVFARRSYLAQPSKLSHTPQSPGTWPKDAALYCSFEPLIPTPAISTLFHKINCYHKHRLLTDMRVAVPRHNKSAAPFYPVVSFADHYNRATPTKDHPRLEFATSHGVQFNPFDMAVSGTFNSLSKVLFKFRSRYLFAIGFRSIFSLR
jgi:hypothetical protein